jgi:hypothetical protein
LSFSFSFSGSEAKKLQTLQDERKIGVANRKMLKDKHNKYEQRQRKRKRKDTERKYTESANKERRQRKRERK